MGKKFLVTGGAGFIGSAVIKELLKDSKNEVLNIDKLTYAGNLESLAGIKNSANYSFEQKDICNFDDMLLIFQKFKPNIVMHLAAESHVDRSIDDPDSFINTNIFGTYNLLKASKLYLEKYVKNDFVFKFHHISTDEVYGDLPHPDFYSDKLPLFKETSSYKPSSPYSASKASSDHLVRAWMRTYNLPAVITNCSNNYGPFQFPEKLIPLVILNALNLKKLPIYGGGNQIRDWLFVEDHARALKLVADKGIPGETYNIGGHNEKRNIDVVRFICKELDRLSPINKTNLSISSYSDLITYVDDRPGHDMRYAIDASKIQKELNFSPSESFDSGMKKTIKWYLSNIDWCQRVLDGSYKLDRLEI